MVRGSFTGFTNLSFGRLFVGLEVADDEDGVTVGPLDELGLRVSDLALVLQAQGVHTGRMVALLLEL
jgi:hypothetical protein